MYSPADRPSRSRHAPAKNRIWSIMGGISSEVGEPRGLPVLRHSISTSSSVRASSASANRRTARLRCEGVVVDQDVEGVLSRPEGVIDVLGLRTGSLGVLLARHRVDEVIDVRPAFAATDAPSMKFLTVYGASAIGISFCALLTSLG